MNYTVQTAKSNDVLHQTVLKSESLPISGLTDKRVRYLMALGLSENVARVMAKPQPEEIYVT